MKENIGSIIHKAVDINIEPGTNDAPLIKIQLSEPMQRLLGEAPFMTRVAKHLKEAALKTQYNVAENHLVESQDIPKITVMTPISEETTYVCIDFGEDTQTFYTNADAVLLMVQNLENAIEQLKVINAEKGAVK